MFSFIGRGVCTSPLPPPIASLSLPSPLQDSPRTNQPPHSPVYIFIGSVIVGDRWWKYTSGALIGLVGLAYVVLEYIPSIEPPANMRDADAGWGAEQV